MSTMLLPQNHREINTMNEYENSGGLVGLARARDLSPEAVIDEIKKAGLRGRGGAGFPTHIKWAGVRSDSSPIKYVVCNGSEGEPGTYKDRFLLSKNAFRLIEGLLIAKYAIGAKKAFIGLKKKYTVTIQRVSEALCLFEREELCQPGEIEIFFGPDEYLFGEERALLEVLSGGGAMPRVAPTYLLGAHPSPTEYNPTVVNNIETFNHVANILSKGEAWFRSMGSKDTAGTTIFTLCGNVKRPGMYELPMGVPFRVLLEEYGQGPENEKYPVKAVFSGVANPVLTPDRFDTPMDFGSLKAANAGLGSSGFIVIDEGTCIVEVVMLFSAFLAKESCGQCPPCKIGSMYIAKLLQKIHKGCGTKKDIDAIYLHASHITDQTRCFLSHEQKILIESVLDHFERDFLNHLQTPCVYRKKAFLGKIKSFNEKESRFDFFDYDFDEIFS